MNLRERVRAVQEECEKNNLMMVAEMLYEALSTTQANDDLEQFIISKIEELDRNEMPHAARVFRKLIGLDAATDAH